MLATEIQKDDLSTTMKRVLPRLYLHPHM